MNKLIVCLSGLILLLVITLPSCTNDTLPEPVVPVCAEVVTYTEHIKPIIDQSCAYVGCHVSGSSSGDFSNYNDILPVTESGSFETRVITQKDDPNVGMPPDYAPMDRQLDLTETELELMKCWIDGGFQE